MGAVLLLRFERFPALKTCLGRRGTNRVPAIVWDEMCGEGFTGIDKAAMPHPPSWYFRRNVWVAFFRDPVGLGLLEQIGTDRVLYETDYPHTDTMWPTCQESAAEMTSHLDPAAVAAIVAENARALFRIGLE